MATSTNTEMPMLTCSLPEGLTPYSPASKTIHSLRLDRTEPPIPYRREISSERVLSTRSYPCTGELEELLAKEFEIDPSQVLITAGADEAIDRTCRAMLTKGTSCITTTPTFEMVRHYALLSGAALKEVEWLDGDFPIQKICNSIDSTTRLITLVAPNNPTGKCIPASVIKEIALRYPECLVLVDLAYVEFASSDPTKELLLFSNILIVRSFSKAWGLPGLRVGYAVGSTEVVQWLRTAGGPYSVATASIEQLTSQYSSWKLLMQSYVERIRFERADLFLLLRRLEIPFIESESNFILLSPQNAECFDRILLSFDIRTRSFSSPLIANARRLTLPGDKLAFERVKYALKTYSTSLNSLLATRH